MLKPLTAAVACLSVLACMLVAADPPKTAAPKPGESKAQDAKPDAAAPQDIEAMINKGLAAYKAGKNEEAVAQLQQAITAIQSSRQKGLAALFPKAPEGWQADEIQSQSGSFSSGKDASSYVHLTRTYTRKQGENNLTVTMTILNIPQLLEAQQQAAQTYRNPEFLKMINQQGDQKVEAFEQDGWFVWTVVQKDQDANLSAFGKGAMITLQVSKDDGSVLKTFWKGIDLKAFAGETPQAKPAGK